MNQGYLQCIAGGTIGLVHNQLKYIVRKNINKKTSISANIFSVDLNTWLCGKRGIIANHDLEGSHSGLITVSGRVGHIYVQAPILGV